MTGSEIALDIYTRLSSRRFLLTLVSVGTAYWQYSLGSLTPVEFQTAVVAAVTAYLVSEGITDAADALKKPTIGDTQTVNVGSDAAVTATPPPPPPDAPHDDGYQAAYDEEDAYYRALATVRAEEARKRRERDARRRRATPLTEPVTQRPTRMVD